ncbi:thiol:disulfide interchange protein DsbG [Alcanivorax sp. MD8A]|uniref:thiol:disulfide interchange protein DsbG n=1 Tax=Alcanivorax sp. MD8A TaxID=1177157 RepID=UPI000CB65ABC|nr:thiol:disulfide interchange protein DsbG [Alcanivorax sp. MD8A]PNE03882.1 thiol:disulfide interchange protein DsbG [Alcanivorax sp. MD8A]
MPLRAWLASLLMLATLGAHASQANSESREGASMDSLLARLENSSWVAEGPAKPQRVAYVFTDMACPYCAQLWENMQPLVTDPANKLQVRHIIVGMINPKRSFSQGGAVLAADNPAAALALHESRFEAGGIEPLLPVPAAIRSQIHNNTGLMIGLGLGGTPTLVFEDRQGQWRVAPGVVKPDALRDEVFQLEKPKP